MESINFPLRFGGLIKPPNRWPYQLAVSLSYLLMLACSPREDSSELVGDGHSPNATATLMATVDVDFAQTIVAVTDSIACVLLSYSPQIECVEVTGRRVGVFGATGDGPAEFGDPEYLVRGEGGRVGVIDVGRNRLSVWTSDGAYLEDVSVPFLFKPVSSFGESILGIHQERGSGQASEWPNNLVRVLIPTGRFELISEIRGPSHYGYEVECSDPIVQYGNMNSSGIIVFGLCSRELMFWRSNQDAVVVRQPYEPQPLNARDIEEFRNEYTRGLGGIMSPSAIDDLVQGFTGPESVTPYNWGRTRVHDGWDQLWVAILRDRIEHSYFNVYSDTVLAGTVRVRDRVKAFDIFGNTLVVLVEREPTEGWSGIWRQAIDWYRLGDPG